MAQHGPDVGRAWAFFCVSGVEHLGQGGKVGKTLSRKAVFFGGGQAQAESLGKGLFRTAVLVFYLFNAKNFHAGGQQRVQTPGHFFDRQCFVQSQGKPFGPAFNAHRQGPAE